jgi:hypothetical protein
MQRSTSISGFGRCCALALLTWAAGIAASAAAAPPSLDWTKTWGGSATDSAQRVARDAAGNLYVVGQFAGSVDFDPGSGVAWHTSGGGQDVFLSKFSASGAFQWARTWGGSGRDVANGLGVDSAGNVYVTGPFQNTVDFNRGGTAPDTHNSNAGGANNIYLTKFSPDGAHEWART